MLSCLLWPFSDRLRNPYFRSPPGDVIDRLDEDDEDDNDERQGRCLVVLERTDVGLDVEADAAGADQPEHQRPRAG